MPNEQKRRPVDVSEQMVRELEALSAAEVNTKIISEKELVERKFPLRYNKDKPGWIYDKYEWNEEEIRKFYEDPENVGRTIFCPQVNKDELDDWGMFGYTPGFIFIEKVRYKGSRTLADKASALGLSIAVDPKTGLGLMNHFDYFPKLKFDYELIKQADFPELFALMCDIFTKRRMADNNGGTASGMLPGGNQE